MRRVLGESDDVHFQHFTVKWGQTAGIVIFIEGLTNTSDLQGHVLQPLMERAPEGQLAPGLQAFGDRVLHIADRQMTSDPTRIRDEVYHGKTALLVDGFAAALLLGVQGWEERSVESPPTESGLRGPRDGFVENITANIALVRRRLCDPGLRVRFFRVGARTQTKVAMLYLDDLARPRLVQELATRISAVSFDGILDTNQLREFVAGSGFSPFPKMESTERPDRVTAALLSGKVAVLMDTSPFVTVAPATLPDFLWATDDYYTSPAVALLVRLVRVLGWLGSTFLPALYIAIEMYNPDLIRSDMALFLARERVGVPLGPSLEIYFLEAIMEMLYEATVRLPSKVGSAATVVGGLIIGQAAVQARVISAAAIIVAALAAIGSFTYPGQEIAQVWRAAKWLLLIVTSFFGVYGLFAAAVALFSYLAAQDSFGTPYLAPLVPLILPDLLRDSLYRKPWDQVRRRPRTYGALDPDRTSEPQSRKYQDGGER